MSSIRIYLDESGDLGWIFDAPRGRRGFSRHAQVTLIPDRTNGAERLCQILEGVLKIALIEGGAHTKRKIIPTDSRHDLGVQFADYLAGVVWQSYEFEERDKQMGSLACIKRSMLFKS